MQNEYTQISDPGNWRYNTYKNAVTTLLTMGDV